MNTSIMFVLTRIFLLIACCTTLVLGKCDVEKAKDILKKLKEIAKMPAKFDTSEMELLFNNKFYLNLISCPLDQAKPLYKQYAKALEKVLQLYENACPQFSTKMKEVQNCRSKLVASKLFENGVVEFCRQYDQCSHIYNNTCEGLRNLTLVSNVLSIAATEVCKLECKAKDSLLNQMSNCWGFVNTKKLSSKDEKFNDYYQCLSSDMIQGCSLTQGQALRILPLFSLKSLSTDIDGTIATGNDCVTKWRILEDLETWTDEICVQLEKSKDCILSHLKDEKKKIMYKIHCKCYPANNNFPKFNILDPEHKIKVSVTSGGTFDRKLSSVMLLLVARLAIQL